VPGTETKAPPKRYVILAEEFSHDPHYAKTARGVMRYRRDSVVAMLDSKRAGEIEDGVPIVGTVNDALCFNPNTALVGVVTQGGHFPGDWQELLKSCVAKGLDLENGLHVRLRDIPGLPELATRHGVELRDLREPPTDLSTATGENLEADATIVLTVGSDCAIGKMTATCELDLEARSRGLKSVFVPTGQTGIAIAGWGISVDAVVSDFLAGAAERLVVEGAKKGDLLWVEGQGAILHPIYSGVTVGLIHGSAPHLYVLCHEVGRTVVEGDPTGSPILSLGELIDLHERMSLKLRPAKVAAVALNTSSVSEEEARTAIADAEKETGLAADDPVRFGAGRLLDAVLQAPTGRRRIEALRASPGEPS
jgi:D-glutamate N-acetyltransferase